MERKIISIDLLSLMVGEEDIITSVKAFGLEWQMLICHDETYTFNYRRTHLKMLLVVLVPDNVNYEHFEHPYLEQPEGVIDNDDMIQPVTIYFKYRGDIFALTLMFNYPNYENYLFHIFIETQRLTILVNRPEYMEAGDLWQQ